MSKYYLLKFDQDYADEFSVYGTKVVTEEKLEEGKESAKKLFAGKRNIERYFGTNEAVEWYDYNDYMRSIKATEISQEQYDVLLKLGLDKFGWTSFFPLNY